MILVGEVRDTETAKIGFDAAQTGHLFLSTLHTNDSVSSVSRLLDLEIDRAQIASSLACVLAQRLVRRMCPSCIKEYVPHQDEWFIFFKKYPSHLTFYKGEGCEACDFTGYKGRTLLSEVFVVDNETAKAITKGIDVDDLKGLASERGMKTMLEDGLLKLRQTTLSELIRVIPHGMIQTFRTRSRSQDRKAIGIKNQAEDQGYSVKETAADSGFLMSDPENEGSLIDRMYERYRVLASQTDTNETTIDRSIFGEFVNESFHEICQKHQVGRISFSIERSNGKIEISAIPWK